MLTARLKRLRCVQRLLTPWRAGRRRLNCVAASTCSKNSTWEQLSVMVKHRVLSPDSFVSKFAGNEDLLRGFARLRPDWLDVDIGSLNVVAFRWFVEKG